MAATAPRLPSPPERPTRRGRSPGRGTDRRRAGRECCGGRSQREIASRDYKIGLAHAKDLDQLACVLEAAEIGAVVDDLLGEGACEAGYHLELIERRCVEADSGEDGAGCTLRSEERRVGKSG